MFAGRKVGIVLSGGNIDTRLLASVLLRGLVRDGRIVRLRLMIGDLPGQVDQPTMHHGARKPPFFRQTSDHRFTPFRSARFAPHGRPWTSYSTAR